MDVFLQQLVNGLSLGGIYALIALGYTMVYGIIELINFAHGDVYTLGTFFSLAILTLLGVSGVATGPLLIAVVVVTLLGAMILCGLVGVVIERLAYRRLRNAPRLAPLITAIGMSFILENVMQYWHGPSPIPFPQVIPNPDVHFGVVTIATKQILVIALAIAMMIALQAFIYRTRLGKAMRATAQDRDAAQLMGIDINTTIALTFLIGSALAGAAGFVSGVYYGSTWFFNGFAAGLKAFTAAVLGGIGNLAGAMLGGFAIGVIEAMTAQYVGDAWSNVAVFLILVAVLIFRPSGLLGESVPAKSIVPRIPRELMRAAAYLLVAAVLPLVVSNGGFVNFLADAGAFVLLALGLNIVVGFAGLLDLGYAAFFAIGSYAFAMLASPQFGIHLPFWVLLFVASGIAALFGILLGAPTLRLRGDYLAIVTLGFGEIVPQTFQNFAQWTGGPNGIGSLDQPAIFGYRFGFTALPYYYLILALIAVAVLAANNLRTSRLGRAWMAIREDELAAAHVGINTTTAKLAAFAIGASFSGLAGCAYASKLQLVSPDQFGFNVSVAVLSMLVLGGMGNIPGVILGSLVISSLDRFILPQLTNVVHGFGLQVDLTNSRFLIYGVILVMTMLFRPEGLLPSRQRKAELRSGDPDEIAGEQTLYTEVVR